jgi:hypothetical protein
MSKANAYTPTMREKLYHLGFSLAKSTPPTTAAEAQVLVDEAIRKAKTKADLLEKALPYSITHADSLQAIVAMHDFPSWFDFLNFGKRFVAMPPEQRWSAENFNDSFSLACCIAGPFDDTAEPTADEVRLQTTQTKFLAAVFSLPLNDARVVYRRVAFQMGPQRRRELEPHFSKSEIIAASAQFFNFGPKRQLLALTGMVPVVDGKRSTWPSLSTISVKELLAMPLAILESRAGFGYAGWEHAVTALVHQMKDYSAFQKARLSIPFAGPTRAAQNVDSDRFSTLTTRLNCRDALEEMLKPFKNLTVLDALTSKVTPSGFYNDFGTGSVDDIISQHSERWDSWGDVKKLKKIAFKEPVGPYFLTIVRFLFPLEDERKRLYEVEAMLHNEHGESVAKAALAIYLGASGTACEFMWAMDEIGDEGLIEVGLSFATETMTALEYDGELGKVAILREWEVRNDMRGKGLGKLLLDETFARCLKGPTKPNVLAVRLAPAQFEVPHVEDWPNGHQPELMGPALNLRNYWEREIAGEGSFLFKKDIEVYHVPYIPAARADDTVTMMALGGANQAFGDLGLSHWGEADD